jgi:hypothetical protein
MSYTYDHSCLVTAIKNTSGREAVFSFLPPHGRKMAANATVRIYGDIWSQLTRGGRSTRKLDAFLKALDDNDLEIVATPAPVLQDQTIGHSRLLRLNSNTLGVAVPCWDDSLSASEPDNWL